MSALKRAVDQTAFDKGDVGYIILSGALVLFMVPGLMFLYAGLSRRKNALSLIWACFFANAVVTVTWYVWGYSLAFSPTATNGFIGNLEFGGHHNVMAEPSPGSPLVPALLYSFFQMEFCAVTVAILMGAIAERGRLMPTMLFVFFWVTLVYAPVACWVWNINGWAFKYGVLDFAGGGPVEIGSGVGGLAYSWVIGRRNERELINFRPHNVTLVTLGTFMLWFGWIGFNAGSAFGANLRAVYAALNTCIAASTGGIVWCLLDYRIQKKYTMIGLCSGTIAGLVAATPSSGFIPLWASVVLGIVASSACNYGTKIKHLIRIDDALDLFAEHALAGIIGLIFNGFFATTEVISLDDVNTTIPGGFLDQNYKQLYIQIAYIVACCAYVFVVTAGIAKIFCLIPGLNLRATDHAELIGIDDDQIGEFVQDFVEVRRAYDEWAPPTNGVEKGGLHHQISAAGDRHGVPDTSVHTPHLSPHAERPAPDSTEKV
ncbi:hypothetical protein M408DRAFT_326958 [Serendipita vermifera MAFF 305830]|uniref:Ammonium transporter n=1 Tax=Serendipita vermifera MAFF 305830 TaxID=933852 RepID=A0A0C2X281_SERVB|nr:hypothetical protein M408DRAFT_326958 [Serendipita vermifera MAFF 305830]